MSTVKKKKRFGTDILFKIGLLKHRISFCIEVFFLFFSITFIDFVGLYKIDFHLLYNVTA